MNKRQRKKYNKKQFRDLNTFYNQLYKEISIYSGIDLRHITPTWTSTAYEYAKNFYSPKTIEKRLDRNILL